MGSTDLLIKMCKRGWLRLDGMVHVPPPAPNGIDTFMSDSKKKEDIAERITTNNLDCTVSFAFDVHRYTILNRGNKSNTLSLNV